MPAIAKPMPHTLPELTSDLAGLLPALSPIAVQGSRLLHDRRLAHVWSAPDDPSDRRLTPVPGRGPSRLYDVVLDCDAGIVRIAVATNDDGLAMVAAAGPDARMRALALDAMFGQALEGLAVRALPGLRIASLARMPDSCAPEHGWCALRRAGEETCRIALHDLSPGVQDALLGARMPASARGRWRNLCLRGTVDIGERRLSVAALRSLEAGDVLLLPLLGSGATLQNAPATLRIGSGTGRALCAGGRLASTSITLLGELRMMDHDTSLTREPDLPASALDELEVPVHFELETVSIPLADLEAIEPGYVIELGTPAAQARLRLVSCGVVIGEADLVAVAGRLGARITNLVPRG